MQSRYDNMSVEKTAQMRETLDGSNGMYRKTNGEEVIEVLVWSKNNVDFEWSIYYLD